MQRVLGGALSAQQALGEAGHGVAAQLGEHAGGALDAKESAQLPDRTVRDLCQRLAGCSQHGQDPVHQALHHVDSHLGQLRRQTAEVLIEVLPDRLEAGEDRRAIESEDALEQRAESRDTSDHEADGRADSLTDELDHRGDALQRKTERDQDGRGDAAKHLPDQRADVGQIR